MSIYPKSMFFESESVTEGHLGKVCGEVFDAVFDECLGTGPQPIAYIDQRAIVMVVLGLPIMVMFALLSLKWFGRP